MKFIIISTVVLGLLLSIEAIGQNMNNEKLENVIESVGDSIEGARGAWQFLYNDRLMIVFTDESHDRMRIISPVKIESAVTAEEMRDAMTANFHSALDVKYALSDGLLWTAFIHPLSALSEAQLRDAFQQVYRGSETFGTTYSSTELIFPGGDGERGDTVPPTKKM